ncbi:hypothetical protein FHS15_003016 [Paenibacillus castaneae]|uniref:hypothetical protein n=1 Tax=Paenibacillus castaneae TaxID=474957 RepID=UPI000C9B6909|nr:hypothetical protein [Paenibacillus castaneae]NIK77878.1 hypothetical protein [Paenibacillus castaneae]
MNYDNTTFNIKNPSGTLMIFILLFHFMCGSFWISRNYLDVDGYLILYIAFCGYTLLCLFLLAFVIYRTFMKAFFLSLHSESISISDQTILAVNVDRLMVMGYVKPIVGIKLKNKKIVPLRMSFQFLDNEDMGIKECKRWAEHNHIPFVHRRFMRWL